MIYTHTHLFDPLHPILGNALILYLTPIEVPLTIIFKFVYRKWLINSMKNKSQNSKRPSPSLTKMETVPSLLRYFGVNLGVGNCDEIIGAKPN